MSAHQLHRMLGVTYKTAWFLAHRIREAMREISPDALGGWSSLAVIVQFPERITSANSLAYHCSSSAAGALLVESMGTYANSYLGVF
jgi:hypothetical protein